MSPKGYPDVVCCNPDGSIANIFSLADVEKYFSMHCNNEQDKAFVVENKPCGSDYWFIKWFVTETV